MIIIISSDAVILFPFFLLIFHFFVVFFFRGFILLEFEIAVAVFFLLPETAQPR